MCFDASLLVLLVGSLGYAATSPPPALDAGAGSAAALVEGGGGTFMIDGLTFSSPQRAWSRLEQATVAAALEHLPALLKHRPLVFERTLRPCKTDGLPTESEILDEHGDRDGVAAGPLTRVHLCDGKPTDLGRQAVLTLIYAVDLGAKWSERPDWRLLGGWRSSLATAWRPAAENIAPEAHLGTGIGTDPTPPIRALVSPRWDLVTFAAAALLDERAGDQHVGCAFISQNRFLRARLRELDGGNTPGTDPFPRCDAFEQWAALDRLADVELVLAAPSSVMVGSLFGHVLLRLDYRDETGAAPLDLARAVTFLADNDAPFADDPAYALKGVFGRFTASLHERPFLTTYRDYVIVEGRDLRRWRLNLDADERRRLLERIWTLRQASSYRYYFFARNCATLMVDLLNAALTPERAVTVPGVLAAPPSSILERFERARTPPGTSLVTYIPEPVLAFEHQARLASRQRRAQERRLLAATPAVAVAPLAAAFANAHTPDANARASAYFALAPLLAEPGVGASTDVYRFLHASAVLESHFSIVANLQAEEAAHRTRREQLHVAVDHLFAALHADRPRANLAVALMDMAKSDPARRLDGYRSLAAQMPDLERAGPAIAARARLLVLLQSESRYDVARMKAIPGLRDALLFPDLDRPIDEQTYFDLATGDGALVIRGDEARQLLRIPLETRVGLPLLALQRTEQVVFRARGLDTTEPATGEATGEVHDEAPDVPDEESDESSTTTTLARAYAGDIPRSGIDQIGVMTSVGGTWIGPDAGTSGVHREASLVLTAALYDEQLGDHRRFGFPSHTSFVVARSTTRLTFGMIRPAIAAYDSCVIGYRSLTPRLPEAGGLALPLGWELALDVRGDQARALTTALVARWGLIALLWARDDLANHLLATGSLEVQADFPSAASPNHGHPQSVAGPVGLELRHHIGRADMHRSHLAAKLFTRPTYILNATPVHAALDAGATLEGHLALRSNPTAGGHDPALLIAAQALHSSFNPTASAAVTEARLLVGLELR